jgi:hypothetical protein
VLTHQDICDPNLQNTVLLVISPTPFNTWTSTSGALMSNAINNLLATPLAPSVARPNVVERTYGFVAGTHECGNESSGSIKWGEFPEWLKTG